MRLIKIKIHENDLGKAVKRGVLEYNEIEHKSPTMHYGYYTITYSYNGKAVYSYERTKGFGDIKQIVEINICHNLYKDLVSISAQLNSFKSLSWADKFFNKKI